MPPTARVARPLTTPGAPGRYGHPPRSALFEWLAAFHSDHRWTSRHKPRPPRRTAGRWSCACSRRALPPGRIVRRLARDHADHQATGNARAIYDGGSSRLPGSPVRGFWLVTSRACSIPALGGVLRPHRCSRLARAAGIPRAGLRRAGGRVEGVRSLGRPETCAAQPAARFYAFPGWIPVIRRTSEGRPGRAPGAHAGHPFQKAAAICSALEMNYLPHYATSPDLPVPHVAPCPSSCTRRRTRPVEGQPRPATFSTISPRGADVGGAGHSDRPDPSRN